MAVITKKGATLAATISPYVQVIGPEADAVAGLCSRIARLAGTHRHVQETACNRELTAYETERDEQTEAKITSLVASIAKISGVPMHAVFTRDPRGFTVRIKIPSAGERAGNTWGLGAEFGI